MTRNRWSWLTALIVFGVLLGSAPALAGPRPPHADASLVARNYIERFYPRWFSYEQSRVPDVNALYGPDRVTPLYGAVVAINVDTLYASAFVDLKREPVILTIPQTDVTYSMLRATTLGNIFEPAVPAGQPGVYALTTPDWRGKLPRNVTRVKIPYTDFLWIFRADKYSSDGQEMIAEAEEFRRNLRMAPLSEYRADPDSGPARIVTEAFFAIRFKVIADTLVARAPITFLRQLQTAVNTPGTAPLTREDKAVAAKFDRLFGNGQDLPAKLREKLARGAQEGHSRIIENYLDNTGDTNWVNFRNLGRWAPDEYLDRSSVAEFLQWGNSLPTANYWHAFEDGTGTPLDGSSAGYVLTFPPGGLPQVSRFWSLNLFHPE
ncbi:DUF1254 domain-containing protein [Streptomyces sp. NPDC049910]|uniref:DUF1254 domain-containing protein n=1 Tax=Streptomyces sp. NPDC049910 TaxID=3155278 RepID=UPI003423FB4F